MCRDRCAHRDVQARRPLPCVQNWVGRLRSTRTAAYRNPAALRTTGPSREPPNPGPRRVSPTHLLQKFGHIIHLVVQDQPGALAVVVLLDLLQGVVLDGLVRRLGHFGTPRASGPVDSSHAGRSKARLPEPVPGHSPRVPEGAGGGQAAPPRGRLADGLR